MKAAAVRVMFNSNQDNLIQEYILWSSDTEAIIKVKGGYVLKANYKNFNLFTILRRKNVNRNRI